MLARLFGSRKGSLSGDRLREAVDMSTTTEDFALYHLRPKAREGEGRGVYSIYDMRYVCGRVS